MNKLSGEGLFDERPTTQTSLGRFVLWLPDPQSSLESLIFPILKGPFDMRRIRPVLLSFERYASDCPGGDRAAGCRASDRRPVIAASEAPTFSDTFSGGTLDSTKWFVDTGTGSGKYRGSEHRDAQRRTRRSFYRHVAADPDSEAFPARWQPRSERRFDRSNCSATEPTCGWRERHRPQLRLTAPVRRLQARSPMCSTSSTTANRKLTSNIRVRLPQRWR